MHSFSIPIRHTRLEIDSMRNRFHRRAGWHVLAAAAVVFLAGCGGKGTVSGKVTLNGQPLPGGMVYVNSEAPETEAFAAAPGGRIQSDGTYRVDNVTTGKARISVVTSPSMGSVAHPTAVKDPWGPYVALPEAYKDPAKSPFTLDVHRGKQTYDIAMTGETKTENKP
jgi:hypothetical protein